MEETKQQNPVTGSQNPVRDDMNQAASLEHGTGSLFLDEIVQKVTSLYPGAITEAAMGVDMPAIRVRAEDIVEVARWLRDEPSLEYKLISDLTCADYLGRDPRFDVVYHLYSLRNHSYLRVKVGVPVDPAECPTVTDVWPGANWLEREVWDMYGIRFVGHPNLERILTPDGWIYHALRRDFPLQGPGMVKLFDSVTDVF